MSLCVMVLTMAGVTARVRVSVRVGIRVRVRVSVSVRFRVRVRVSVRVRFRVSFRVVVDGTHVVRQKTALLGRVPEHGAHQEIAASDGRRHHEVRVLPTHALDQTCTEGSGRDNK